MEKLETIENDTDGLLDDKSSGEQYEKSVELLAAGLTKLFEPHLQGVKSQLVDLAQKQELICRELHEENLQLCAGSCNPELIEIFTKARSCREKLLVIRNKMTKLHDQSKKLQKRVLKLEQTKQNEAKVRIQQREKEERLIGKHPL